MTALSWAGMPDQLREIGAEDNEALRDLLDTLAGAGLPAPAVYREDDGAQLCWDEQEIYMDASGEVTIRCDGHTAARMLRGVLARPEAKP